MNFQVLNLIFKWSYIWRFIYKWSKKTKLKWKKKIKTKILPEIKLRELLAFGRFKSSYEMKSREMKGASTLVQLFKCTWWYVFLSLFFSHTLLICWDLTTYFLFFLFDPSTIQTEKLHPPPLPQTGAE